VNVVYDAFRAFFPQSRLGAAAETAIVTAVSRTFVRVETPEPRDTMTEKKPNGLQKVLQPSAELSAVIGATPLSRGEVVSKMWAYIKSNNLQNPANKREIVADAKLKPVFGGKDKVDMFEMNKHLANHLK
jgi:chromatin remodeling complex protein RSC6